MVCDGGDFLIERPDISFLGPRAAAAAAGAFEGQAGYKPRECGIFGAHSSAIIPSSRPAWRSSVSLIADAAIVLLQVVAILSRQVVGHRVIDIVTNVLR